MPATIDAQFVGRIYRTTTWVAAVVLLALVSTGDWKIMVGFLCGVGVALALLKSHEILVPRFLGASHAKGKKWAFTLALVILKYVALFAILWALFAHEVGNLRAFFGGVVLVQWVIFLKVIGILVMEKMNAG